MSKDQGDQSWSSHPKWNAIAWMVCFLAMFGGCVMCYRNPEVPLIQITFGEQP